MNNLFSAIPKNIDAEIFEDLLRRDNIRIERILSRGQTSPESGWYDQDEHEWVIVLQGAGKIAFEDGTVVKLETGDYLNIPARQRHKVIWTDTEAVTIWLAVFYR